MPEREPRHDRRTGNRSHEIETLSLGVGALYFVGYNVYVLVGWDPVLFLPAVVQAAYLFDTTAFVVLWELSPPIDSERRGFSVLQYVGLYVLVVPAGAVAAEVLYLFVLGAIFAFSWMFEPVAWYQRQWLDVTGFVGPLPFLVYTLLTAMLASVLALAARFGWDRVRLVGTR